MVENARIFRVAANKPRSLSIYERMTLEEVSFEGEIEHTLSDEELAAEQEAILTEARAEAERKVKEAYEEGLRRGTEAGRDHFLDQVAEAAEMLKSVSTEMMQAREHFLASLEPQVIDLVSALMRKLIHRELLDETGLIHNTVRNALRHLVDRETVTIRINPADEASLRTERIALLEEFDGVSQITVMPDDSITRGGCIVEATLSQVDARIESQLELLLTELQSTKSPEEKCVVASEATTEVNPDAETDRIPNDTPYGDDNESRSE